eukprot:1702785-Pleurochrysis_carterae.AAC.1
MQTTNIPIIDHSHAFAALYNEYVEPPLRVRNSKNIAAPAVSPITRPGGQTPLLLQPAETSETPVRTDTSCVRATRIAPAKRPKRATPPPPAA